MSNVHDITPTKSPRNYHAERELGPGGALMLGLFLSAAFWVGLWRVAEWMLG